MGVTSTPCDGSCGSPSDASTSAGQHLLVPEIEIEGWWTSLEYEEETIIALYAEHGTSEHFHSELKSDLDIERLPLGKFATDALVLACARPSGPTTCV